jgi:hypothetical protein
VAPAWDDLRSHRRRWQYACLLWGGAGAIRLAKPVRSLVPEQAGLVDERGQCLRDVRGSQGSKPQCPRPIWLLTERVRYSVAFQLGLVLLCPLITRGSVECRIESIPTVIHGPDRKPVGHRARPARQQRIRGHPGSSAGRCPRLDVRRAACASRDRRASRLPPGSLPPGTSRRSDRRQREHFRNALWERP